jgi:hypothetical protein
LGCRAIGEDQTLFFIPSYIPKKVTGLNVPTRYCTVLARMCGESCSVAFVWRLCGVCGSGVLVAFCAAVSCGLRTPSDVKLP